MPTHDFDLAEYLDLSSGLPQPTWDLIEAWAQERVDPEDHYDFYTAAARQWLIALADTLGSDYYATAESEVFLALAGEARMSLDTLLRAHAHCRRRLVELLPGIAEFSSPGKLPVLVLYGDEAYYAHISHYHAEGEFGGSAGMQIRGFYPHVVLLDCDPARLHVTLAHELTHAALLHLSLPLWIEEGLAQMFEHDVTGQRPDLEVKEVRRQKEHWRAQGLEAFWSGEGFSRPDKSQQYSYQLAEFLVRLLLEEFRTRWFGFDHRDQQRLMNFLQSAREGDAGQSAAEEHLGFSLGQLAAKSLGNGDWDPLGGLPG